jgi:anti-anti-sigma regulatory factor/DNA-directed RNA polymerase subunit RPC12/RpoP
MIALRLGRLDVQLVPGAPTRVTMVGRIDDSANLGELAQKLTDNFIVIDTGGVTFINSIGMREWMRLLRGLRERGAVITLERVADVLMTQMNMIPESAKGVHVASFHAQYACAKCGAEAAPLVDAVAYRELLQQMRAPKLPCPECGFAMELGDFPERYLGIFRSP